MKSSPLPPEKDPFVCFCHGVRRSEIREAIQRGADSIPAIQRETLASTGCGGCESDLLDLIQEFRREASS